MTTTAGEHRSGLTGKRQPGLSGGYAGKHTTVTDPCRCYTHISTARTVNCEPGGVASHRASERFQLGGGKNAVTSSLWSTEDDNIYHVNRISRIDAFEYTTACG